MRERDFLGPSEDTDFKRFRLLGEGVEPSSAEAETSILNCQG
jgi:hypothetical protein